MNILSRTITGILLIILGLFMVLKSYSEYILLIYGVILLGIGIYMLFNVNEDKIEKIKKH